MYVYICGKGKSETEAKQNRRFKRKQIKSVLQCLKQNHLDVDAKKHCGHDTVDILLGRVLLTMDYSEDLSRNFRVILDNVGQHAAGDEKLSHFNGESIHLRLVPNKRSKIGLWFYYLACKLKVGDKEFPFMLDILLHANTNGTNHVTDIVQRWMRAIEEVETKSTIDENRNQGKQAWLAFDSNYATSDVRSWLIEKGQEYIGSVKSDRFIGETAMIHRLCHAANKLGKWKSIHNPKTHEVFTYHYDSHKGVRKQYCLSCGLDRSEDRIVAKQCSDQIPAYSYLKNMFEVCDNFNQALHGY